jgi:hypothetical protein
MADQLKEFNVPIAFDGHVRVLAEDRQQATDVALSLVLAEAGTRINHDGAVQLFDKHEMEYQQSRTYEQLPVNGTWRAREA